METNPGQGAGDDGGDQIQEGSLVRRLDQPDLYYLVDRLSQEAYAVLDSSLIGPDGNYSSIVRRTDTPFIVTNNLTSLQVAMSSPEVDQSGSEHHAYQAWTTNPWILRINKGVLGDAGITVEEFAKKIRSWETSFYGCGHVEGDLNQLVQFRLGFDFDTEDVEDERKKQVSSFLNVSAAYYAQHNASVFMRLPPGALGVLSVNGQKCYHDTGLGGGGVTLLENATFFSGLKVGDIVQYIRGAPDGQVELDEFGNMSVFYRRVTGFKSMYKDSGEGSWEFQVWPVGIFKENILIAGVSGFMPEEIKNIVAQNQMEELFVDAPHKGRVVDSESYVTSYHNFRNSVELDVSLQTDMSKVIQTHAKTLVPLLIDFDLRGKVEEFALDKKVYSPTQIFDVFTDKYREEEEKVEEQFEFGVDSDGSFMISMRPGDYELHISKAFVDKYNLDNWTSKRVSRQGPFRKSRFVTSLALTDAVDESLPHPEYRMLVSDDRLGDVGAQLDYSAANPNIYTIISFSEQVESFSVKDSIEKTPALSLDPSLTYYRFKSDEHEEQKIGSAGKINIETRSHFTELIISGDSPSFSSQIGINSDHRVLFSVELPTNYSLSPSNNPLRCANLTYQPLSDIIVQAANSPQYLRVLSAADLRFMSFYVESISREGKTDYCYLPENGVCVLKVRMYVGK